AILRKHLQLRRTFLPYFYTLAEEAHRLGWPMVRPLLWLSPEDSGSWGIDDCFLLGEHLLVAPALEPEMEERKVQLPAGTWVDYWTDEQHSGPGEVTIPTPLDRVPFLIRAGAVIPRMEENGLVLDLYAPAATSSGQESSLYLDEGDGYGPSRHDRFYSRHSEDGWSVEWKSQGDLPFPYPQIELQFHPPLPAALEVDDRSLSLEGDRIRIAPFKQLNCKAADHTS
ncbi:MAG: alpha-glucosidase, partial [Anaerolineales bacterium]